MAPGARSDASCSSSAAGPAPRPTCQATGPQRQLPGVPLPRPSPEPARPCSQLPPQPPPRPPQQASLPLPPGQQACVGGRGNSPLATSEGRWREGPSLQPSPTAPASALRDPHLIVLPVPAWMEVRPLLSLWKDRPELPLEFLLSRTQEGLLLALSHCSACLLVRLACPAHSRHQWWPRWRGSGAPRGCDVLERTDRNQETSERDSRLRTARMWGC